MTTSPTPTITVLCEQCGNQHVAEYSHDSQYGGHPVYAAECPQDFLTDYYTLAAQER